MMRRYLFLALFLSLYATPTPADEEEAVIYGEDPRTLPSSDLENGAEERPAEEPYQIEMQVEVEMNYVFEESPDNFIIKYSMNLEGETQNKKQVIQGQAHAKASVEGFLAKWPSGECVLNIEIEEIPFEMIFAKLGERMVRVNTKHEDFEELWRSNCLFSDAPGAKFTTTGKKERWFAQVLSRASHILRDIKMTMDPNHRLPTTLRSNIQRFMIADPPLGSAEIDGKLVLTVTPKL